MTPALGRLRQQQQEFEAFLGRGYVCVDRLVSLLLPQQAKEPIVILWWTVAPSLIPAPCSEGHRGAGKPLLGLLRWMAGLILICRV